MCEKEERREEEAVGCSLHPPNTCTNQFHLACSKGWTQDLSSFLPFLTHCYQQAPVRLPLNLCAPNALEYLAIREFIKLFDGYLFDHFWVSN